MGADVLVTVQSPSALGPLPEIFFHCPPQILHCAAVAFLWTNFPGVTLMGPPMANAREDTNMLDAIIPQPNTFKILMTSYPLLLI